MKSNKKLLSIEKLAGSLRAPHIRPISDKEIIKIRETAAITKGKI